MIKISLAPKPPILFRPVFGCGQKKKSLTFQKPVILPQGVFARHKKRYDPPSNLGGPNRKPAISKSLPPEQPKPHGRDLALLAVESLPGEREERSYPQLPTMIKSPKSFWGGESLKLKTVVPT